MVVADTFQLEDLLEGRVEASKFQLEDLAVGTFQLEDHLEASKFLEDLAVGRGYLADTVEAVVAHGLDIHKPHSDQQSVRTGVVCLLGWHRLVG